VKADEIPGSPSAPEPTAVHHEPIHGEPEIRDVLWHAPDALHPGSVVDATVLTSANVGYVEGRIRYWNVIFRNVAPGTFALHYRVPLLPPSALGTWNVKVIARSIDGVEVQRTFQFTYHYL
jgi:hypothetical protein